MGADAPLLGVYRGDLVSAGSLADRAVDAVMAIKLTERTDGVHLMVKVVPGAKRDRIVGELGEALKVAVSKPPEGGAANRAVVELLREALGVKLGNVTIVRGHSSARKEVVIGGITAVELSARLGDLVK
jgi:uncharacterized protein (TIGR00251 family)